MTHTNTLTTHEHAHTTAYAAPARKIVRMAQTSDDFACALDDVVILLAANEFFTPYTAVTIQSIVENVTRERHVDIIVLTRDIQQKTMNALCNNIHADNVHLRFLDVRKALAGVTLPYHGHFRPETYFRLLAPWILPNVKKAIYLDSDLVVLDDLSKLFDTNVDGYLLAATPDADTIGQLEGYDDTVGPYLMRDLNLSDPYAYFQAGVLVMNLEAFRNVFTIDDMLKLSCVRTWRWLDQDILNMLADGSYVRLDMRWNTLMDWKGLRRMHIIAQAPQEIRQKYEDARANPAVIHYAGPDDRPWNNPTCDFAVYFWDFASRSALLDVLEERLNHAQQTMRGRAQQAKSDVIFRGIMPAFDKLCPPGSKRRCRAIKAYVAAGGDLT